MLAIVIYAPTLEGRDLLQAPAVTVSRMTDIYALLLGTLGRSEGERGEIRSRALSVPGLKDTANSATNENDLMYFMVLPF
jgi:hypothetical protein